MVTVATVATGTPGRPTATDFRIMDMPAMAMQHLRSGTDIATRHLHTLATATDVLMAIEVDYESRHLILGFD